MNRIRRPVWTLVALVLSGMASGAAGQEDSVIRVEVTGRLNTGILAVGGETTGTTITADGITWELDLGKRQAVAGELDGKMVRVHGVLRRIQGVERGTRWVVRVDRIEGIGAAGADAPLIVESRRDDTRARVHTEVQTVVDIVSPMGIDRAVIRRSGADWPQPLVVRLQLRGLEGFRAMSGDWLLERVPGDPPRLVLRQVEREAAEDRNSDAGPIVVRHTRGEESLFEIRLPTELFRANPESITVEWVDFYR